MLRNLESVHGKPHLNIGILGHGGGEMAVVVAALSRALWKHNPKSKFFNSIDHYIDHLKTVPEESTAPRKRRDPEFETANRHYTVVNSAFSVNAAVHIRNRLTGFPQMDGAILMVEATGPLPQTREHIQLARRVGVPFIVVALNNVDRVDDQHLLDLIELEVRALLSSCHFPGDNLPVVRVSACGALHGDAKWEATLGELMAKVDEYIPLPERAIDKPFLMPIEDIFSIPGRGTMVTGRIEKGICKVGEEMEIVGLTNTRKTVVTSVEMFKEILDEARAGDNVGLLLRGIEKNDVQRGQVIAKPGSIQPHQKFAAQVYILSKEEGGRHTPFFTGFTAPFYFHTTDVTGVAKLPEATAMAMPGDSVILEVELSAPVAVDKGSRFTIRDGGSVIGAGMVSEILP